MAGDDESLQIESIVERLSARYPLFCAEDVRHTVLSIHHRFDSAPVRDFVPLLVEKSARRDLERNLGLPGIVRSGIPVAAEVDVSVLVPLSVAAGSGTEMHPHTNTDRSGRYERSRRVSRTTAARAYR